MIERVLLKMMKYKGNEVIRISIPNPVKSKKHDKSQRCVAVISALHVNHDVTMSIFLSSSLSLLIVVTVIIVSIRLQLDYRFLPLRPDC